MYNSPRQKTNPWQDGAVTYPAQYYSRAPVPADYVISSIQSGMPHWPSTTKTMSYSTFSKNFVQPDNPEKTEVSDQRVDASMPAYTPATSSGTVAELGQLKWQVGQGPLVDLRLLVPGKVGSV